MNRVRPVSSRLFAIDPMTRLFVGNLPATATDASLRAWFTRHGKVERIAMIIDRETGRPRAYGLVEMPAPDALRAIQGLHDQEFEGRNLQVSEAQERPARSSRRGKSRRY
jgi:RNA recognition motif-containing protein